MGRHAVYDQALNEAFFRTDFVNSEISLILIDPSDDPSTPENACAVRLREILMDLIAELDFAQEEVRRQLLPLWQFYFLVFH